MKKQVLALGMAVLLSAFVSSAAFAQYDVTQGFPVTVNIPTANAVNFTLFEIFEGNFTEQIDTAVNFNEQGGVELSADGVWLPKVYYAIDVAPAGGSGNPTVDIVYVDEENPNSTVGGNGLLVKGTATAVKVAGAEGAQTEDTIVAATLGNINGEQITPTDLAGGFLRLYLGIATGAQEPGAGDPPLPPGVVADPAGAEPFTAADVPGSYEGTLTLNITLP